MWRDHPRMGGEKQLCGVLGNEFAGITPAWAGKSAALHQNPELTPDHPRVGGEKAKMIAGTNNVEGSPPHGRGKVGAVAVDDEFTGITPAWAGKCPASQPWSPPLWMMVIRPRP